MLGVHATVLDGERVACGETAPRGNNDPRGLKPSVSPLAFLAATARAGATGFDAYAHHAYAARPSERRHAPARHRRRQPRQRRPAARRAHAAVRAKPLWVTEWGYETRPPDRTFGVAPRVQALYLRQGFALAHANPRIDMLLWFLLRDEEDVTRWQSGLETPAGKRKPAFAAFRAAAAALAAPDHSAATRRRRGRGEHVRSGRRAGGAGDAQEQRPPPAVAAPAARRGAARGVAGGGSAPRPPRRPRPRRAARPALAPAAVAAARARRARARGRRGRRGRRVRDRPPRRGRPGSAARTPGDGVASPVAGRSGRRGDRAACRRPRARRGTGGAGRHRPRGGGAVRLAGPPPYCGGGKERVVALTFDDGPGPYTAGILRELEAHGAQATFFLVGNRVRYWPALPAREAALGAVGDHTWSHPSLPRLRRAQVRGQLVRARATIARAAGVPVRLFRPPYEAHDRKVDRAPLRSACFRCAGAWTAATT